MSQVGQKEKETQKRVVAFFSEELEYDYLGDWTKRENRNVEVSLLEDWLKRRNIDTSLISRVLHELGKAAALGEGKSLYEANKEIYRLLRYGVKVKGGAGEQVWG